MEHWKALFPQINTESYRTHHRGARVLEIGVWEGRSAVFLANELLPLGSRVRLYASTTLTWVERQQEERDSIE